VNLAYVEMIGGASGNMLLGAFVDAGAGLDAIERALRTIPVDPWTLEHERVVKRGIAATYVDFNIPGDHYHAHEHSGDAHHHGRHLSEVLAIVESSGLSPAQKGRASSIYRRLGEAEAKVHGIGVDEIHFHEVGAVDAILDVAATCVALDLLGVDRVELSAFPAGSGSIDMQHGRYPNPPPATLELMRGFPIVDAGIQGELVTTTAAAILTTIARPPRGRPALRTERIGYGAGKADFPIPNVTRVSIGPHEVSSAESVAILEANLDDMNPQFIELAMERLFAAGALDVWLTPIVMKKSRPAFVCSAIVPLEAEAGCAAVFLRETTTLGVRVRREDRYVAPREILELHTPLGTVRVKVATVDGAVRRTLEYDDLARIARERGMPIAEAQRQLQTFLPPL
jgi:uncharacterized protein (TIGR00299 family) protein